MYRRRQNSGWARRGAAAVEMAIASVFILVPCAYGVIEISRAVQVKECLTDAARSGCRVAISVGKANSDVTSNINATLTANNISSSLATITIMVNGSSVDVNTAMSGDKISVKVSVPSSSVNYMPLLYMVSDKVESESLVMMHQ